MIEITNCLICGSDKITTIYPSTFDGKTWEDAVPYFLTNRKKAVHGNIAKCSGCGFVFTSPQFTKTEYDKIYASITIQDQGTNDRSITLRYQQLAGMVQQYCTAGKFLDLGCGNGGFLDAMPGAEGLGFEIREEGSDPQRSENIITGDFLKFVQQASEGSGPSFDFLTAWDVLEHIPNLDAYMQAMAELLSSNGYLFVTVPDVNSSFSKVFGSKWNCILLEHLWYFNVDTLSKYASRFGFDYVSSRPLFFPSDAQTLVNRIAQTGFLPKVSLPDFISDRVVKLPIGVTFFVFRKTAA